MMGGCALATPCATDTDCTVDDDIAFFADAARAAGELPRALSSWDPATAALAAGVRVPRAARDDDTRVVLAWGRDP